MICTLGPKFKKKKKENKKDFPSGFMEFFIACTSTVERFISSYRNLSESQLAVIIYSMYKYILQTIH